LSERSPGRGQDGLNFNLTHCLQFVHMQTN
jgi:hypothetical protein